jgi:hypothetical protein
MSLMSWLMLIAGVVTGGVSVPTVIKPLASKLLGGLRGGSPSILPPADVGLEYLRMMDRLMHKLLDQAAPVAPLPGSPAPEQPATMVSELEAVLSKWRVGGATVTISGPPPAPQSPPL